MKPNFDFQEYFGHIGYFMTGGGLKYECEATGKLYNFPEDVDDATIELLMAKILIDGKDYIFELVKDNEFILQTDCIY